MTEYFEAQIKKLTDVITGEVTFYLFRGNDSTAHATKWPAAEINELAADYEFMEMYGDIPILKVKELI